MRICVLNPSYEGSASPFKGHDPVCNPARHAPQHEYTRLMLHKATVGRQLREHARGFDLFVNLCDGSWDEDRPGIDVAQVLELLDLPFTGATSRFWEPSREAMKRTCRYLDIGTPDWRFASTPDAIVAAGEALRFPLIVKHPSSYGSIGMTKDSRVTTPAALLAEGRRFLATFGEVLIEEFVEGREFTVLVSEDPDGDPHAYLPVECRFPPGETFKHFDLKWVDFAGIAWVPVVDDALAARLCDATSQMFSGLGGTGYGRADVRVADDGGLFMLEMNPQPGVFYPEGEYGSADTILSFDEGGHAAFFDRIARAALARHARNKKAFVIRDNGHGGFGMFAARDLAAGDVIDPWEARPQRLVSRRHASTWTGRMRDWFERYAWPIGEDVFAIWAEDPLDWRPIDHGCDPNSWLDGLDLVARRPIRHGDPITCDYGTFCGDEMAPFDCSCGAAACRKNIRGSDWRLPAIAAFGEHVSPFVAAQRRRLR